MTESPAAAKAGTTAASPRGPGLVRAVGVWALAASIFNVTVGGGIFRLPAGAAAAAGPAAPFVYLICAAVFGCVVLCFAEAGSRVAMTGGPYAYVEAVFGRYVGSMAGVLLWMLGTTAVAGVSSAFAEGLGALLGMPSIRIPVLVGLFALLALVNIRGIEQGTRLIAMADVQESRLEASFNGLSAKPPVIPSANLTLPSPWPESSSVPVMLISCHCLRR